MPIVDIQLNETELNKIKTKILDSLEKDIHSMIKKAIVKITLEKASDHLLTQVTPKLNDYMQKIKSIIDDSGIEDKIDKTVRKSVFKIMREECSLAIKQAARQYAEQNISSQKIDEIIDKEMHDYITRSFDYKAHSVKYHVSEMLNDMKTKIHTIHENQEFLAKKIGVMPQD